jgi:hypothetical protein
MKKKKNKKQAVVETVVEEPANEEEAQQAEPEEELVVHNKKGNGKKRARDEEDGAVDEDAVKKAVKQLNEVSSEHIEQFKSAAETVAQKHKSDPIVPLAAALAILSGATKVNPKSVLTDREVNKSRQTI